MKPTKMIAKQLPDLIAQYATEHFNVFFKKIAEECNIAANEITEDLVNDLNEDVLEISQQALIYEVACSVLEVSKEAYGNTSAFNDIFNHIMFFIEDPEGAKNSLDGERPTSAMYLLYEKIFGKYHDNNEMNIVMLYDICYYILTKKAPKFKGEKQAVDNFTNVFIYETDKFFIGK